LYHTRKIMAINISDEELRKVTGAGIYIDLTETRHRLEDDYILMTNDCEGFIRLKGYKEAKSLYELFVMLKLEMSDEIHERFKD